MAVQKFVEGSGLKAGERILKAEIFRRLGYSDRGGWSWAWLSSGKSEIGLCYVAQNVGKRQTRLWCGTGGISCCFAWCAAFAEADLPPEHVDGS